MTDQECKRCARCGLPIRPGNETWLEYSQRDFEYHPAGEVAPEDSLGGFAFGPECKNKPNAPFDSARRERNEMRA